MSDIWRRSGTVCTDDPRCFRECRCSRWPDYVNRFGNYVVPHPSDEEPIDIFDPFQADNGPLDGRAPADNGGRGAMPWTAGTWTIAGNLAVNTPVPGAEQLINGDFEIDANWGNLGSPTTNERSNVQAHTLVFSRHLITDAAAEGCRQDPALVAGTYYLGSIWLYATVGSAVLSLFGTTSATVAAAAWTQRVVIKRRAASDLFTPNSGGVAVTEWYADDASLKPLTRSELLATLQSGVNDNIVISAAITEPSIHRPCGVVACLDNAANPLNFVIAWHNGIDTCYLDQCVAGAWTQLLGVVLAYEAGARIGIEKVGTTYRLWYNGDQVGADQVIAGLTGTLHGVFNTNAGNTIDEFRIVPAPVKILTILGDSQEDQAGEWPDLLAAHTGEIGMLHLNNHSVAGQSILLNMDAQTVAAAGDDADIIIIGLGFNDIGSVPSPLIEPEYRENLLELLGSNTRAQIFCASVFNYVGEGAARLTLNGYIQTAAANAGCTYWDTEGWIDPLIDTGDGVHPNAAGSAKIRTEMFNRLRALGLV